jgi:hypothetical protein
MSDRVLIIPLKKFGLLYSRVGAGARAVGAGAATKFSPEPVPNLISIQ